jgi:hypothetical protein
MLFILEFIGSRFWSPFLSKWEKIINTHTHTHTHANYVYLWSILILFSNPHLNLRVLFFSPRLFNFIWISPSSLTSYFLYFSLPLTLIQLMWRIWWAPNNANKWQMGFNSAFKELNNTYAYQYINPKSIHLSQFWHKLSLYRVYSSVTADIRECVIPIAVLILSSYFSWKLVDKRLLAITAYLRK